MFRRVTRRSCVRAAHSLQAGRAAYMRTFFVGGLVSTLVAGAALAQVAQVPGVQFPGQQTGRPPQSGPFKPGAVPGKPAPPAKPTAQTVKPAPALSTPESRSAAALALSSDPVFDDGTYLRIKQTLLSYSDIEVRGGWPIVPVDAKIAPGASGPAVALLRKHLVITGDMPVSEEPGDSYDDAVTAAVKKFQRRHGLEPSGSVGAPTLKALNVPVGDRIKQLEASLERLRGMDFLFAERYVVVNIPAAFVEAVAHGRVERRYRVIVGKVDRPSPTLTAYITAVDLNPTWTVPLSITKNEIIRHMRSDPSYLSRMHMRVLGARDEEVNPQSIDWSSDRSPNFTVRQDSGGFNALGNVKIDMPNPYSVYMHDTPSRNLFADDYRFDSHGCTRVDNVRDLAAWVLEDVPGWNRAAIDADIAAGHLKVINLPHRIPVAWVYVTGWVTRDGTVNFREDVYKHDDSLDRNALANVAAGGFVAPVKAAAPSPPREI